ncbi:MAG TPA: BtpA/SgcQ family protein [Planctomycetota bacterium]|nr:BtpA/SgcQ family protein [Planctomycetota bacterium]
MFAPKIFPSLARHRVLLGVVHLQALPGAPAYAGSMERVLDAALEDAHALLEGGADGLIVENFGDRPFFGEQVPAETIAAMARCLQAVCAIDPDRPVGANVLRNDARAALGLVAATDARFVRVNVHTGAAVTDQGVLEGRAAQTLRERARLCPGAGILADVHVKHASPMGSESLEQAAQDTWSRGMADGLVVSGAGTGQAPEAERVARIRRVLPKAIVFLGSGVDETNVESLCAQADGAIVASSLKRDGVLEAPVDADRVRRLVQRLRAMGPAPAGEAKYGA